MTEFFAFLGVSLITVIGVIALILIYPILFTFGGAVSGWVVAWAFDDTWITVTDRFNWEFSGWETGAFFGFLGSFFKARLVTTDTKN